MKKLLATVILISQLCASSLVYAQQNAPIDIIPAGDIEKTDITLPIDRADTDPPLKLTPDRSELVRLPTDAGAIIIGNPDHVSILADSAKTLIFIPKAPGSTYVTILDMDGNLIMQRHILVASPKPEEKYVRIRRTCAGAEDGCQETQIYYCPDMCHQIRMSSSTAEEDTTGGAMAGGLGGVAEATPEGSPAPTGNDGVTE